MNYEQEIVRATFYWHALYMRAYGMKNSNQILHDNQTLLGKKLQVYHATCPGEKFVTRMLTRHLFQVADLCFFSFSFTFYRVGYRHTLACRA